VSGGCPLYRLAAQNLWAGQAPEGRGASELRREPLERALLRLLGLVGLLLFLFDVLGRAAPPRSLPVKALSPLLLALAAWGLERVRE